jgi:ubiquinone/menaquinone biosynthesis C-methylase UbiE
MISSNCFTKLADKLKEGITVLDSACGPAHWTVNMAETYPNSKFYGVDMSNVFPSNNKPVNTEFVTGNIVKRIPFPDNTFDYIHQMLLVLDFTNDDWNAVSSKY